MRIRTRELRKARNLTQVKFAKELGVSKQNLSNWENNNIFPSVKTLIKIARYFSVSTDYLLGLDDRKYIEITGLNEEQIAHFQQIINEVAKGGDKNEVL